MTVMGKLIYADAELDIDIDDRPLAHLQIVIASKLRRGESFFFSWKDDPSAGGGRSAIWLDRSIPLYFKYSGSRAPAINRQWVAELLIANGSLGMVFTDEPNSMSGATPRPRGHL
jgi:hypothetical protein